MIKWDSREKIKEWAKFIEMTKVLWEIKQCSLKFRLKGNVKVNFAWFNLDFGVKVIIPKELHCKNWRRKGKKGQKGQVSWILMNMNMT